MLNKRARKLIGYNDLVKRLAVDISEDEIDDLDTECIKSKLGSGYEMWEFSDCIDCGEILSGSREESVTRR